MAQTDGVKESIDGVQYTVYMLDPMESLKLLRRLLSVVSPGLGAALGLGAGGKGAGGILDAEVSGEVFLRAASELFDRLDERLLEDLVERLGEVTLADGKRLNEVRAIHFRGRVGHMLKWLGFALKVQYADFFDAAKSAIARAARVAAEAGKGSVFPSTSPRPG